MNKQDVKVVVSQIRIMKHAIGLGYSNPDRKGVYVPYRNYYDAGTNPNKEWEGLVELGLAVKRDSTISSSTIYHVSKKGLEFLSDVLGITIQEEETK